MSFYQFRDTKLYYKVIGNGKPMLLIHGWGVDHRLMSGCMEPVFETLNKEFKRIYIDLPGMGKSEAGSLRTADEILSLLKTFIFEMIPDENILLMGESFGGYLSRGLVKMIPEKIDGLILLCPAVYTGFRRGKVIPHKVLECDEEFLNTLSKEEKESFSYMNVILTEKVWRQYKKDVYDAVLHQNTHYLSNVLKGECSFDVDDLSEAFTKPTLMLVGKQDTEVGYEDQFKLIKLYPNMSYVAINRAGHNLQNEQPLAFAGNVTAWLMDNF